MTNISKDISSIIRLVTRKKSGPIRLHEPLLDSRDSYSVAQCVKTGNVSTAGTLADDLGIIVKDITGTKYALCVNSGTSALHLGLLSMGVGIGCEVFVPSLSFVATANAVLYTGAKVNFIDSDLDNLALSPLKLEESIQKISIKKNGVYYNKFTRNKLAAVIITTPFGYSPNYEQLLKVSKKYNIPIVEDAAASLGSQWKNRHHGTIGLFGIISLNGNKIISSGAGGVLLTNNKQLYEKAKHLSKVSKIAHQWEFQHSEVGYNFRMPNLNAALGISTIQKLSSVLLYKKCLHEKYFSTLQNDSRFKLYRSIENNVENHWLNLLILSPNWIKFRNEILDFLNNEGIQARPIWKILPTQKYYSPPTNIGEVYLNSIEWEKSVICLPSSPKYGKIYST
jgi:perosamine synthetase